MKSLLSESVEGKREVEAWRATWVERPPRLVYVAASSNNVRLAETDLSLPASLAPDLLAEMAGWLTENGFDTEPFFIREGQRSRAFLRFMSMSDAVAFRLRFGRDATPIGEYDWGLF